MRTVRLYRPRVTGLHKRNQGIFPGPEIHKNGGRNRLSPKFRLPLPGAFAWLLGHCLDLSDGLVQLVGELLEHVGLGL